MAKKVSPASVIYSLLFGALIASVNGSISIFAYWLPDHVNFLVRYVVLATVFDILYSVTMAFTMSVVFIGSPAEEGVILTHWTATKHFMLNLRKFLILTITMHVFILYIGSFVVADTYFAYFALTLTMLMACFNVSLGFFTQKKIYRVVTIEGKRKSQVSRPPKSKLRYGRNLVTILCIMISGSVFAIVAEEVKLWAAQSTYNTYTAIGSSILLKIGTNFILRAFFMRTNINSMTILFIYALNITLIGTPMRLLCNYLLDSDDGDAVSAVAILGATEVSIRLTLIATVALKAKYKLRVFTMEKEFLAWKKKRFNILEAENYAEMLSEYLTILFSVLIFAATERKFTVEMVHLTLIQIGVELSVDWICLHIEKKMGMPIASVIQSKKGFRLILSMNALLAVACPTIPMFLATKQVFLDLIKEK